MKQFIAGVVRELSHTVLDLGAYEMNPDDDYPDYAEAVGKAIQSGKADRGILLCGSGVGASIAASKMTGIRAALCHDTYSARQGVEHDDMDVLCLGARIIGPELARELVEAFAGARFMNTGKYLRRVEKMNAIEQAEGKRKNRAAPEENAPARERLMKDGSRMYSNENGA